MRHFLFALSFLTAFSVFARFTPYEGEPPAFNLTEDQQARVARGELVIVSKEENGVMKQGSIAFRINASQAAIWRVLSDFSQYPHWGYKIGAAGVYNKVGDDFYVDFMTDTLSKHYYVINHMPMKDWSTWKTDHSKAQDCVMDTVGYWRMKEVDGNSNVVDVMQYGKMELTSLCSNGFFGIGGFDADELARVTHRNLKARAEALM